MMRFILTAFLIIAGQILFAADLSGIVFTDSNNNGIRDRNESGIKGVAVSDQVQVVLTDANGNYHIVNSAGYGYVFISLPQGYTATTYYHKIDQAGTKQMVDFALTRAQIPTDITFIHASDIHISEKSLDRIHKLQAVIDSIMPDFVLVTGDLVKDALRVPEKEAAGLYELYLSEIKKISMPVWNVPGNHEIFGIERELSKVEVTNPLYGRKMYRHYMGPDYYSFNFGGIHFIALNSLDFDDMWYYGSIDSIQRIWLKNDLSVLSPVTPVVTFQHVPFISGGLSLTPFTESGPARSLEREKGKLEFRHVVSNAHEVIGILQAHPFPLALAGHFHTRQRFFLETTGQKTRFEQTAAVVAPVVEGPFNMPSGVVVYHIKEGKIDEGTFIVIR